MKNDFDEFMRTQGFSQTIYHTCVYLKDFNNEISNLIISLLYKNYIFIIAKNQSNVNKFKNKL